MELYLIRHGIAADPANYEDDEERPLTAKGDRQTQKVAKRLSKLEVHFDLILTSPLVRARQTAEILKKAGLSSHLEESSHLSPSGDINAWLNWLEAWRIQGKNERCLAIVGHQPNLGDWAQRLVWGIGSEKLLLKKAGIIGLLLPETISPLSNSQLFLLTAPKWFL